MGGVGGTEGLSSCARTASSEDEAAKGVLSSFLTVVLAVFVVAVVAAAGSTLWGFAELK